MSTSKTTQKIRKACGPRTRGYQVSLVVNLTLTIYADVTAASHHEAAQFAAQQLADLGASEMWPLASCVTVDGIDAYHTQETEL